ncbi:MAG: flagellin [Acidobacteriota bacterium]
MGSFSILNNIAGINAQNQLNINNVNLNRTMLRMSSGRRINSGADDAAGLQIADSLRANIRAIDQAIRNANDGIAVAQIADGALQEISNLLTRAFTLAEQAATETVDSTGRTALNQEFTYIEAEIARIAVQTNFNGLGLFTTSGLNGDLSVFVGDISNASSIRVVVDTITADATAGTVSGLGTADLTTVDLSTQNGAIASFSVLKAALDAVATNRAGLGAGMNRLQAAVAVLQAQSQNSQAAESTIRDANMAQEITNLTKYQILAQSGIAALAQANQSAQLVLALLRQ